MVVDIRLKIRKCNGHDIPDRDMPEFKNICDKYHLQYTEDWLLIEKMTKSEAKFLIENNYM